MKRRAAIPRNWRCGRGARRAQLACGEGVEGAEAVCQFGVAQATLAVQPSKMVNGGAVSFLGIALQTTSGQVPVRIAAELGLWHDMVKTTGLGR